MIKQVRANIKDAISYLADKMEIPLDVLHTYEKPDIFVVDKVGFFDRNGKCLMECHGKHVFSLNRIEIGKEHVKNIFTLAEEASHYLHGRLNPEIHSLDSKPYQGEFWNCLELRELVGGYGALSYVASKGRKFIFKDFELPEDFESSLESKINALMDYHSYKGHVRAEKAFKKYGDSLLPVLPRLSLEEAKVEIPRLIPINAYEQLYLPIVRKISEIRKKFLG